LPTFTAGSSENFRIPPDQVQIDTTHFRPQHHVKSVFSETEIVLNRTAVTRHPGSIIALYLIGMSGHYATE